MQDVVVGDTADATFDEVVVYPIALTPDEVIANWTAGGATSGACSAGGGGSAYSSAVLGDAPVAYYRLDEDPEGSPVAYDSSGHCRNGAYTEWAERGPSLVQGDADPGVKNKAQVDDSP
jgi:hypothetical protein